MKTKGLSEAFCRLCYSLAPPPSKCDNESDERGKYDPSDGSITFTKCGNYHFCCEDMPQDAVVKKLVVRGGNVWNCGEDGLSRQLLKHRETLEEIVYVPDDTKDGTFIRPYYGTSSPTRRSDSCVFPLVKRVTLKASGVPTMLETCIFPTLESVAVHAKDRGNDLICAELVAHYPTLQYVSFYVQ
jgi:hypothetical protein